MQLVRLLQCYGCLLIDPTQTVASRARKKKLLAAAGYDATVDEDDFVVVKRLMPMVNPADPMINDLSIMPKDMLQDLLAEEAARGLIQYLPEGDQFEAWMERIVQRFNESHPKAKITSAPLPRQKSALDLLEVASSVELLNRPDDRPGILSSQVASQMGSWLPVLQRLLPSWTLVYSSLLHGISLQTMLDRAALYDGPTVLAVMDSKGTIFGGFASSPWRSDTKYYGTGESFLWKLQADGTLRVFEWTGRNDYFMIASKAKRDGYIAMGGGEGRYGLWLHESLLYGHSSSTMTFRNDVLASTSDFEVNGVELWGVDPSESSSKGRFAVSHSPRYSHYDSD